MMESMNERDRYIGNPLRLLRCGVELGGMAVRSAVRGVLSRVDDALDVDFDPAERIYDYKVEAPVKTEEELNG